MEGEDGLNEEEPIIANRITDTTNTKETIGQRSNGRFDVTRSRGIVREK